MLRRKLIPTIVTAVLIAGAIIQGCVRDKDRDCTRNLNISFYSQTVCQSQKSYPPQIRDLKICLFDGDDILIRRIKNEDVTLNPDYSITIDVEEEGLYHIVTWSGIDRALFDVNELRPGETKKSDLLFRLGRVQGEVESLEGRSVYFGESPIVYVSKPGDQQETKKTGVNMEEVTNRFTIIVEGLPENNLQNYTIDIEANNASMNIDGSIAGDDVIRYPRTMSYESGEVSANFTTLKLETGTINNIVIRDTAEGRELFRGSLLGALLLENPNINPKCVHDFTIRFTTMECPLGGTYIVVGIYVNEWLVSSYDVDMQV